MRTRLTQTLKGTLEGMVLTLIARQPAHGYEITERLRQHGFTDLAASTVYAALSRAELRGFVNVESQASEKGPPRNVYSLSAAGRNHLESFWECWSFLSRLIEGFDKHETESS